MKSTPKVSYKDVDFEKISISAPEEKTVKGGKGNTKYFRIPVFYNYGTAEKPIKRPFSVEYPKLRCSVTENVEDDGKTRKQLCCDLLLSDPEAVKVVEDFHPKLLARLAALLMPYKVLISMPKLNTAKPEKFIKQQLWWRKSKETGEVEEGTSPRHYIKMDGRSHFVGPDDKKMEPKIVSSSDLVGYPAFTLTHLYRGLATPLVSPQIVLSSFAAEDFDEKDNSTMQTDTTERMRARDPELVSRYNAKVAAQVAALRASPEPKKGKEEKEIPKDKRPPSPGGKKGDFMDSAPKLEDSEEEEGED